MMLSVDLRHELCPPNKPHRELADLVERAFEMQGQRGAAAVAEWLSAEAGVAVDPEDLHGWAASLDPDQVARSLTRPPAHELRKLAATRDELIEIARRWLPTSSDCDSANEDWWMAVFDANVPRPAASNAAFYPPAGASEDDITPEWITDHALAYRAIEL